MEELIHRNNRVNFDMPTDQGIEKTTALVQWAIPWCTEHNISLCQHQTYVVGKDNDGQGAEYSILTCEAPTHHKTKLKLYSDVVERLFEFMEAVFDIFNPDHIILTLEDRTLRITPSDLIIKNGYIKQCLK